MNGMNDLEDRVTGLLARSGTAVDVRPDVDRVRDAAAGPAAGARAPGTTGATATAARPRRLLLAAALVVLVALAGATAVALTRDDSGGTTGTDLGSADVVSVGDPPGGWLVPTSLPEGLQAWTVDWSESPSRTLDVLPQLFGDPDGGRALLVAAASYEVRADLAEEVTVRGQPGRTGPSWDVEERDMGEGIAWDERGVTISALYQGMTADEAIAALDALEWRSDDPADGFSPPDGGPLPLRAEATRGPSAGRDASLVYSDGPPSQSLAGPGPRLELSVYTSTDGSIPGRYLAAWYEQGPAADGGRLPLTRYDEDGHHLSVVWPDGRSIDLSPAGPQDDLPDRDVLERVADSVTTLSEADLSGLQRSAEAMTGALPVVASAETRIGTVEVHGEGGFVQLCRPGEPEPGSSCPVGDLGGQEGADGDALVIADWVVDGTWYVVVASKGNLPNVFGATDPTQVPDMDHELPAETATSGEWTIRLIQPDPDIQLICTGSRAAYGCGHERPT